VALALVGLLALPAALDAWQSGGGDTTYGGLPYRTWIVQRDDLALPWGDAAGGFWTALHPLVWLGIGALAALMAGRIGGDAAAAGPDATPSSPRFAPAFALGVVALVLQVAGGERFRERWPVHWGQQVRDYCEAARAALGPRDHLFTAVHTTTIAWQLNYYLGDRWTDLGMEPYLSAEARQPWLAGIESELTRVHLGGGTAYLGRNGLLLLAERSLECPLALAAARSWLSAGRVVLWMPP
jgi:hypothetical protein